MNKDVIYIDVDDDVTAIIGKIKKAKEKIVALVPPKRVGVLQSAVNLRLLDRMAKNAKKQLVLITHNQALVALAANAQIPVAKNLQTKPEIAEIPALVVDDGDDIIDGADLPVGDHAETVKVTDGTRTPNKARSDAIEDTDLVIDTEEAAAAGAVAAVSGARATRAARSSSAAGKRGKSKIPNFDSFRKKLVLIISGVAALTALLIWMFVFAPAATVVITASTAPNPISTSVKLGGTEATNLEKGIISSLSQSDEKDVTIEFTATGEKDVGDKATGVVRFGTSDAETAINGLTIPAGTRLTAASGAAFITDEAATISTENYTNVRVGVTAAESGTSSNGASGSLSGAPSRVYAALVGETEGGTTKIAKVVSKDDVERAKGQLVGESTDEEKQALIAKFQNGEIVIDSSFTVERGKAVSKPAIDAEAADGKATLTISTTYSIQAVSKTELDSYLKAYLDPKLEANQKIYSTGIDTATISNFRSDDDTMTATITATGRTGPEIDEAVIKDQVKGKIYGEVQQNLQRMDGIKEVDVQFSYFWVRRVPTDINKISIEFKVDTANE